MQGACHWSVRMIRKPPVAGDREALHEVRIVGLTAFSDNRVCSTWLGSSLPCDRRMRRSAPAPTWLR
jgi:hypothetical protein